MLIHRPETTGHVVSAVDSIHRAQYLLNDTAMILYVQINDFIQIFTVIDNNRMVDCLPALRCHRRAEAMLCLAHDSN